MNQKRQVLPVPINNDMRDLMLASHLWSSKSRISLSWCINVWQDGDASTTLMKLQQLWCLSNFPCANLSLLWPINKNQPLIALTRPSCINFLPCSASSWSILLWNVCWKTWFHTEKWYKKISMWVMMLATPSEMVCEISPLSKWLGQVYLQCSSNGLKICADKFGETFGSQWRKAKLHQMHVESYLWIDRYDGESLKSQQPNLILQSCDPSVQFVYFSGGVGRWLHVDGKGL